MVQKSVHARNHPDSKQGAGNGREPHVDITRGVPVAKRRVDLPSAVITLAGPRASPMTASFNPSRSDQVRCPPGTFNTVTLGPAVPPMTGPGRPARDFVPESHRRLPMLRVLLPLIDRDDRLVRWSDYVSLSAELASLSWWTVIDRTAQDRPEVGDLVSCRGALDAATLAGLDDVIGASALTALRWVGYAEHPVTDPSVRVFGNEFSAAPLCRGELRVGERVPEFAWDEDGAIAWGTHLYPDSLILAGEITRIRRAHADPRLDTIIVRPDVDVLPASWGD